MHIKKIIANKPAFGSSRLDEIVCCEIENKWHPFVTWIRNPHNGVCVSGRYFETREEALADFEERR